MIEFRGIDQSGAEKIAFWNGETGEAFLTQWAGVGYNYPLDAGQIMKRAESGAEIFAAIVDDEMVATIEIIKREPSLNKALIGRYILNPELRGKGLGTKVMSEFMKLCAEGFDISVLDINVYDFNKSAYNCYLRCGFEKIGVMQRENGWNAICMEAKL